MNQECVKEEFFPLGLKVEIAAESYGDANPMWEMKVVCGDDSLRK